MDPVAHFSIALAASKLAGPQAPLLVLGAATQVPDLLFFGFQAAGLEHKAETKLNWKQGLRYLSPPLLPWSHGLLMSIVWSLVAGAIVFPFYRDLRTSVVVGLMVLSHWVLDAIVYPNLPLTFEGSREVGLGLITTGPGFIAGIILEVVLIGGGIAIYLLA
jgi:membrane-bound metal-dependent hydrolase YbcI (DUF457 family)